jgi:hypothetical protein
VIGEDLLCLRGIERVEFHEVGDQCLTQRQILLRCVKVHARGELHRTDASAARGEDTRTLAVGVRHDGVAIGKQGRFDQADGLVPLDWLRSHEADGGSLENVGVLDESLVGQPLVDAEHVHDGIVRELKRNLVALDDECFGCIAGENGAA